MKRVAPEAANYHVVEVSPVDAHTLEQCLNEQSSQGHVFEGLHFVMSESSRRPSMAFVIFRKPRGKDSRAPESRAAVPPPVERQPALHEAALPLHEPPLHEPAPPLHEPAPPLHEPGPPLHEPALPLHEPGPPLHEPGPPLHELPAVKSRLAKKSPKKHGREKLTRQPPR